MPSPRLAVRAVLLRDDRLLLVNAWKGRTHLWTCPGGGVEVHQSLPEALRREVQEETGLIVQVDEPCLVNEFHDPKGSFHQVDIYFRATILSGDPDGAWTDPEGIVSHRRWVTQAEMRALTVKPDSLAAAVWGGPGRLLYDPLEPILR
jgi:ADP-ribose pyrophosphatase YjhB (NUDIX family)